jgi:hypothetical protein
LLFELTVVGDLSPALEAALAPCVSLGPHATTVVRLRRDHLDLVDTFGELVRSGLEVADITRVD